MKTEKKSYGKHVSLLALLAMVAGCASNTDNFKAAQALHANALAQSEVATLAPVHMQQAEKNLKLAAKQSNDAKQDHYSYLATKHVEIAMADTKRKEAEKELVDERMNRNQGLLAARTREADEAHQAVSHAEQISRDAKESSMASRAEANQALALSNSMSAKNETLQKEAKENSLASKAEADRALAQSNSMLAKNESLRKELADVKSRETNRGLEITLEGSYFGIEKSNLKDGAKLKLDTVARAMRENPNQQAVIEGHTDNTGTNAFNQELSQERADSVSNYLIAQGVKSSHLTARGYGETYPTVSNNTASGRQQNRRVDIVLLNQNAAQKEMK